MATTNARTGSDEGMNERGKTRSRTCDRRLLGHDRLSFFSFLSNKYPYSHMAKPLAERLVLGAWELLRLPYYRVYSKVISITVMAMHCQWQGCDNNYNLVRLFKLSQAVACLPSVAYHFNTSFHLPRCPLKILQ